MSLHGDTVGARGSGEDANCILAKLLGEIEFPAANREKWRLLAEKTLAGASFEDALVSRSDDAIRIDPIYERVANAPLERRKLLQAPWLVVQRIDDPDPKRANRQALDDLSQARNRPVALVFEGAPNAFGYGLPASPEALETVLAGVPLARTHLRIDAHPASRAMADWFVAYLTNSAPIRRSSACRSASTRRRSLPERAGYR